MCCHSLGEGDVLVLYTGYETLGAQVGRYVRSLVRGRRGFGDECYGCEVAEDAVCRSISRGYPNLSRRSGWEVYVEG